MEAFHLNMIGANTPYKLLAVARCHLSPPQDSAWGLRLFSNLFIYVHFVSAIN